MIGIVFATQREAEPFLKMMGAEKLDDHQLPIHKGRCAGHPVIAGISGMGKVAAALCTSFMILKHSAHMVINAGICGALSEDDLFAKDEVFRITQAQEGDCDRFQSPEKPVKCTPRLFSHLDEAKLVTNDKPVFDKSTKKRLAALGELVDMEGAAVARAAAMHQIPVALIKGVSDMADENGAEAIRERLDELSCKLAREIKKGIKLIKNNG